MTERRRVSVSILVLNYNGRTHLSDCLETALTAARRYGGGCAVVCVDNQSTDGSQEWILSRFPAVEVVVAPANDFLFSLNAVVAARSEEIVIVVNNDMRFDEEFVAPLVAHFDDPDVFAAGAAILNWDGSAHTVGPRLANLRRGWFYKWWNYTSQQPALTLEACAGAAAYRRTMFADLGGFDDLYRPGYYEDLDLSYRGWARGWKVIYEPRSRAYHKESATMLERYGDSEKARILYRNHLLFTIKNIGGPAFLTGFFLMLPYRVLSPLTRGYRVPLAGLLRALPRIPRALGRRAQRRAAVDLTQFATVTALETAAAATDSIRRLA